MRKFQNRKLTANFSLYEFVEGTAMPANALPIVWEDITVENIKAIEGFAPTMQGVRDWINKEFQKENNGKELRITITAGFRPLRWEKMRNRSGSSQHTVCAVDFTASNCSYSLAAKVNKAIYDKFHAEKWMGGLAIKHPTYTEKGKMSLVGFIHLDPRTPTAEHTRRGYGARWTY